MADEERFNRLETQMSEMLGLMSRLISDFNQHRREFADVVSVVIATEKKVERLDQRVEGLDQKVEGLDQKLDDFQQETKTNFDRVFRENLVINRRVDNLTPTVSEMQTRVKSSKIAWKKSNTKSPLESCY